MIGVILAVQSGLIGFAPARAWIPGWGAEPGIPFVASLSGSNQPDLVSFNPGGDGTIDVLPSADGFKPADGVQASTGFGKNCQAFCLGSPEPGSAPLAVGLFDGKDLRMGVKGDAFPLSVNANWAHLPSPVSNPAISICGGKVWVFSVSRGNGFCLDPSTSKATPVSLPPGTDWLGDGGQNLVGQDQKGTIYWVDRSSLKRLASLGSESPKSRPAAIPGLVVFGDRAWTPAKTITLETDGFPRDDVVRGIGIVKTTGRPLVFEWRRGAELGMGNLVEVRRGILAADQGKPDGDPDSDAYNRSSSNDGLLDGWKVNGYRGLNMKAMGCKPGHADVICLISRFSEVKPETMDAGLKRIEKFYAGLHVKNPDGTEGINFHPILLDPVKGDDEKNSWQTNRDKFLPKKWRGIVHWMQVTPGGGGQADELSDGGTCGEGQLWAVFVHEFGHQLGLNHEGFSKGYASPIYTSLMNYTYSYTFEDSIDNVHYSDGSLSSLSLHEDDLDETLPFPMDKVKFLGMSPYHFPLKADGNKTLVDWNRNGIFGEKHVKSSITYAYSISGGTRDDVGQTHIKTAPWLFVHRGVAYALYGSNDLPADPKIDPTLSKDRAGRLVLRQLVKPTVWKPEITLDSGGVIGDPVAVSYGGQILCVYQTGRGVVYRWVRPAGDDVQMSSPAVVDSDSSLVPTVGVYKDKAYVFLTNPSTQEVRYRVIAGSTLSDAKSLPFKSSNPVGLCTDTISGQAILGLAQDQDKGRTFRWQYRRLTASPDGTLAQVGGPFWVEGEAGGARGNGRMIALFDSSKDAGPHGRVMLFSKGLTGGTSISSCCHMAHEIADPKFHGGWLVKRYYDEWTTSRSSPAAIWFKGDILYAYRWCDGGQGSSDNLLHVAYQGTGLQRNALTDFDDLSYIRNFGLSNSIPVLSPVQP